MRMVGVWIVMAFTVTLARAEVPAIAHIETAGTGDVPVVLIHNTQGDWRVWESFMERNAERYTMLAVRLAGMGGSEPMPLPAGDPLDEMVWTNTAVAALAAELESRGLKDVYVIGHGLGAVIGMRLAIDHPSVIAGVVCVDAMPAYPLSLEGYQMPQLDRALLIGSGFAEASAKLDPDEWSERWTRLASRQVTPDEESAMVFEIASHVKLPAWRRWTLEQHVPDLTHELRGAEVRLLATAAMNPGKMNYFKTRTMLEEFWRLPYDELPNSEVTLFDDSRHYIFLDRPDAFDAAIARFIAGEEQPAYSYRAPEPEPVIEIEAETDDSP